MQVLRFSLLATLIVFSSCRTDSENATVEGPTFVYADPGRMLPFPSDRFLAKDEGARAPEDEQATGFHIAVEPYLASDPALAIAPHVAEGLRGLDGFGTSAEIAVGLTVGADVTSLTDPATAFERSVEEGSPIQLFTIDPAAPDAGKPLPFVARFETDGNTLFLRPWKPLRASSWYAVVFKPGLRDGQGRSFVAPPGFAAAYHNPQPLGLEGEGYARLKEVYDASLVFALTFRTASITPKLRALADDVRAAAPLPITGITTHTPGAGDPNVAIRVEGWFTQRSYLNQEGKLTNAVVSEEAIPFTLMLPATTATIREPFKVVLAQHGFGSNRRFLLSMANELAAEGLATLAIDAPNHGARGPGDGVNEDFLTGLRETFGLWFSDDSVAIKAWHFRDLLRQQVLAHLQLIQAMEAWQGDVTRPTNEPGADLDMGEVAYIGHSMGAVMGGVGGGLLPELKRVLLNVGGGRITDVFVGNEHFDRLAMLVFRPIGASMADAYRMIAMVQTAIDPGDPINWVKHIGHEPFEGETPRPFLMQNVLHDFLVANHMSFALARSVDAPFVGPHYIPTPGLEQIQLPDEGLQGENVAAISFFRDIRIDGAPVRADHGNQIGSDTGLSQAAPFLKEGIVVEPAR
jgi:hypothetical protein